MRSRFLCMDRVELKGHAKHVTDHWLPITLFHITDMNVSSMIINNDHQVGRLRQACFSE